MDSFISFSVETKVYYPTPADIKISDKFGLPFEKKLNCPVCGVEGILINILAHLNNKVGETMNGFDLIHGAHDWSFKQIGLWLKELGY